ncbi:hypothetical protein ES288_D10G200100v1 [Gossypium darwinii]|uniref:Uncharacterized protein n=1 Tax=Gossypium darwinii TaxID=34276 RepID=A0A5D2B1S9_GOSDA|nr:hypothetical protein ES288_D10G200100v1 [Gossypium darwinii]
MTKLVALKQTGTEIAIVMLASNNGQVCNENLEK